MEITPRKRMRLVYDAESGTSQDSKNSMEGKLPCDISNWKEEHIQNLGIDIQYHENMKPAELLADLPLQDEQKKIAKEFEKYFFKSCGFHDKLDFDIASLSAEFAEVFRRPRLYSIEPDEYANLSEKGKQLFHRLETAGVQFGECLFFKILKRDLDITYDGDGFRKDPSLNEYDFQSLFDAYAAMFSLKSFDFRWIAPFIRSSKLHFHRGEVAGKADILYVQDIDHRVEMSLDEMENIVAVCKVKKDYKETETFGVNSQHGSPRPRNSCIPPHLSYEQLGQHMGELLLYSQQSALPDIIYGILVQKTRVSFTALKITKKQFNDKMRDHDRSKQSRPTLIITRPYDFMKKEDRKHLIEPLIQLSLIQQKKFQDKKVKLMYGSSTL